MYNIKNYRSQVLFILASLVALLAFLVLAQSNPSYYSALKKSSGFFITAKSQPVNLKLGYKDGRHRGKIFFYISYKKNDNPYFVAEIIRKKACIESVYIKNPATDKFTKVFDKQTGVRHCQRAIINANKIFKPGSNIIQVNVSSPESKAQLTLNPLLLGSSTKNTICLIIITICLLLILNKVAEISGLNFFSRLLLLTGGIYFLTWLHIYPSGSYTNDLEGHIQYAEYLTSKWQQAYLYRGREYFHPPFFYMLTGKLMQLFNKDSFFSPLLTWRIFSFFLFMTYCIAGLKCIQLTLDKTPKIRNFISFIFIFWPVHILLASRISNDIAVYALWSITLYFVLRWIKTNHQPDFYKAIYFTGTTFLIKNNAFVPAAICTASLLLSLLFKAERTKGLFNRKLLNSLLFLFSCIILNTGRLIYDLFHRTGFNTEYLGGAGKDHRTLWHFLDINLPVLHNLPYVYVEKDIGFIDYLLRTSVFGEFNWGQPLLSSMISIFLLISVILTLPGIFIFLKNSSETALQLISAVIIPVFALITLMLVKNMLATQDFRFIVPSLIPALILCGKSLEMYGKSPLLGSLRILLLSTLSMVILLSIPLYLFQ